MADLYLDTLVPLAGAVAADEIVLACDGMSNAEALGVVATVRRGLRAPLDPGSLWDVDPELTWGGKVRSGAMDWRTAVLAGQAALDNCGPSEPARVQGIQALSRAMRLPDGSVPERRHELACSLEEACRERVVRESIAEKQERRWESPVFCQRYSLTVGRVARLLGGAHTLAASHWGTERTPLDTLLSGEISPAELVEKKWVLPAERQQRELYARQNAEAVAAGLQDKGTGSAMYECPRCHKKNSHHEEHHTRSADEAGTILCKCLSCGMEYRG